MSYSKDISPMITYVTDADLDIDSQKQVISAVVERARSQKIRVAFRLPGWSDDLVADLVEWYCDLIEREGLADRLLPLVIHDRPELAAAYPSLVLWLPWRNRKQIEIKGDQSTALSVHSVEEAREAIVAGASEIVFGHVFESESHPGRKGRGVLAAVEIAKFAASFPHSPMVTVIGGIGPDTISEFGCHNLGNVAAIRSISRSSDIGRTLAQMVANWEAGHAQRKNADTAFVPTNVS